MKPKCQSAGTFIPYKNIDTRFGICYILYVEALIHRFGLVAQPPVEGSLW
jgi:hypothetical protein